MYKSAYHLTILTTFLIISQCEQLGIYKRRVFPSSSSISTSSSLSTAASSLSACINPSTSSTQSTIFLGNCNNYQYYIQLGIGTPPQYFYFQFDTGSNTLWIPLKQINNKGFNPSQSSTYSITSQKQTITYADQSTVSGNIGSDYITSLPNISVIGSILFINNQNITLNGPVLGIVGMGYPSVNFLDIAYNNKQISTSTFTLNLLTSTAQPCVYYNNIPQNILNGTLYSQVSSSASWQLNLIGMYADGNDLTSYAANYAVIDSGTSLFYVNSGLFQQLKEIYMTNCIYQTNFYICPCSNQMPTLKFMFPGVQVQINPQNYVINLGGGKCQVQLLILATTSSFVLLGDTLFDNYIITFNKNQGQIGFYGNNAQSVGIFGNDEGFMVSQWVMLGFDVAFLFFGFFLMFYMKNTRKTMLKQQLKNTYQQNVYMGNPLEMVTVETNRYY